VHVLLWHLASPLLAIARPSFSYGSTQRAASRRFLPKVSSGWPGAFKSRHQSAKMSSDMPVSLLSHQPEVQGSLTDPSSDGEQECLGTEGGSAPVVQSIVDWICPDGKRRWSVVRKNLSIPIGQQFKEGDYHLVIIWLSHVSQAARL
jgi:hypothetical protein